MSNYAIEVENLSKKYQLGELERYYTFRDTLANILKAPFRKLLSNKNRSSPNSLVPNPSSLEPETSNLAPNPSSLEPSTSSPTPEYIWALKDVSFQVKYGEVLGIIGRNGAGKSTLLKILSRITAPTEGTIKINGRVGTLLEVGTGFHPELTGRENMYLNGSILGMSRKEINKKFDEIVQFAEVEKFLDTPVKRYSSGMNVRLAFAVAAHLETEILIVDEVLAVGDQVFQKKCLGKMNEVSKQGRTVLFVSHNMASVQNLCKSSLLLDNGEVIDRGDAYEVIKKYCDQYNNIKNSLIADRRDRKGNGKIRFQDFKINNTNTFNNSIFCGQEVSFNIKYSGESPIRNVHTTIAIHNSLGQRVMYLSNDMVGQWFDEIPDNGEFVCNFDRFPLFPDTYSVNLHCTVNGILADWVIDATSFNVEQGDFFGTGKLPPRGYGSVIIDHGWEVISI